MLGRGASLKVFTRNEENTEVREAKQHGSSFKL
jgi:hypothetical protein